MNQGIKIIKLLRAKDFQAFYVGGVVRDMLLKRASDNLDIATDAKPDDVEQILNQEGIKTKPAGKQFGTILAVVDSTPVEITTFRSEGRYSDNRHPDEVEFIKDFLQDAKRRDFTINALYYDPIAKKTYDPTNGLKDLKGKLLKFVGDPKKRIDEDALRMLRGVRLATQLGFKLEKNSFAAIKTRAKYIQDISGERIKAELDKILMSENRIEGIRLLDKTGFLKFIIPEMEALKSFSHKSKRYHLEGNMFEHTLLALSKAQNMDSNLAYAIIFHDIGKPTVAKPNLKEEGWVISTHGHAEVSAEIFTKFAERLRFPSKASRMIYWAVKNHMLISHFNEMRPKTRIKYITHPEFDFLLELAIADDRGIIRDPKSEKIHKPGWKAARAMFLKFLKAKPMIKRLASGDLIMKYSKLKPGRELGQKIEDIKLAVIRGKIKNEKDLRFFLER